MTSQEIKIGSFGRVLEGLTSFGIIIGSMKDANAITGAMGLVMLYDSSLGKGFMVSSMINGINETRIAAEELLSKYL